jgi:hypothetical protein
MLWRRQNVQLSVTSPLLRFALALILPAPLRILLLFQWNLQQPQLLELLGQANGHELKKLTMETQMMKNAKMLGLIPSHQKVCVKIKRDIFWIIYIRSLAKKPRQSALSEPEAIDEDGILVDVEVQSVADSGSTREGKTADLDHFFENAYECEGANGKVKKHRTCKVCV